VTASVQSSKTRGLSRTEAAQFLLRGRAFIALIVLAVFFAFMESAFLTGANIEILIKQTALNAILAIGDLRHLTGGIDPAGSIVGFTGIIAACSSTRVAGLGRGLPHTWMVPVISPQRARSWAPSAASSSPVNVAPFIATSDMLLVARGLAGLINGGKTFPTW
jgi:erythritol transport system permease protein